VVAFLTKHDVWAGGQLIDCAGFRDFEIWHLDYLEIQNGFVDIARAAEVCVTTCMFNLY
jgi:putative ribosome biogenesis GTPase RsgA